LPGHLVCVCGLRGSLCLVLFSLALVNGLRNCLPAESVHHLRLLSLSSLDGAYQTGLRLGSIAVACYVDKRTAGNTSDVLLLAG
jgi:hypothetical protein